MKVQKTVGAAVLSLGLLVGLSGYAGATSRSITYTGPDSYNKIKTHVKKKVWINNQNTVKVENDNHQQANTGHAKVYDNTTGGSAISGNATNTNSTNVSATVDNSASASTWVEAVQPTHGGGGSATIHHTGPDSYNAIKYEETTKVTVNNDNYVKVENNNHQQAATGDATVVHNTTGGDAISGDATNTNSTSVTLNVRN